jgi:hypothetical protein
VDFSKVIPKVYPMPVWIKIQQAPHTFGANEKKITIYAGISAFHPSYPHIHRPYYNYYLINII